MNLNIPKLNIKAALDIPTGFGGFHKLLEGGFKRGELWIEGGIGASKSTLDQHCYREAMTHLLKQGLAIRLSFLQKDIAFDQDHEPVDGPEWPLHLRNERLYEQCMEVDAWVIYGLALELSYARRHGRYMEDRILPPYKLRNDHSCHVYQKFVHDTAASCKLADQDQRDTFEKTSKQLTEGFNNLVEGAKKLSVLTVVDSLPSYAFNQDPKILRNVDLATEIKTTPHSLDTGKKPAREQNYLKLRKGFKK